MNLKFKFQFTPKSMYKILIIKYIKQINNSSYLNIFRFDWLSNRRNIWFKLISNRTNFDSNQLLS